MVKGCKDNTIDKSLPMPSKQSSAIVVFSYWIQEYDEYKMKLLVEKMAKYQL